MLYRGAHVCPNIDKISHRPHVVAPQDMLLQIAEVFLTSISDTTIMPPKAKAKAPAKLSKKTADAVTGKGGSGSSNVSITSMSGINKYMSEYHDLKDKTWSVLIGYTQTDIMKWNLVFRTHNKHDFNQQEKQLLLDSFNQNVLNCFGIIHVVLLIMYRDILNKSGVVLVTALHDAKRDRLHLPELKLKGDENVQIVMADKDKEMFSAKIIAAGGWHQWYAQCA